ncbi:STAS domain-containing protein [bacterium]|nr:STAS domain-containing protein [bacterium]
MEIQITELEPGLKQLTLNGRFDADGAGQIRSKFMEAASSSADLLIVEMSQVDFMASTGIRLLLAGAKSIKASGGKMVLAGAKEQVEYPLIISGVDTVIPLYKTVAKAKSSI